jgi:hypothetical protein
MPLITRWPARLAPLLMVLSCITGSGGTEVRPRAFNSLVPMATAADISEVGRDDTLLQALQRHRPLFLKSRGSAPMVSIDGAPVLDLSHLETLRVSAIKEVRLLRAPSEYSGHRDVLFVRTTSVLPPHLR